MSDWVEKEVDQAGEDEISSDYDESGSEDQKILSSEGEGAVNETKLSLDV